MTRSRLWEWSWGVSQQTAGTLLAAGIVYIATVVAGVLTFSTAIALVGGLFGAATVAFAVYAASKVPPLPGTTADQLEALRRLRDEGAITPEEWEEIRKRWKKD
jgi:hypothetical protein